MNHKQRYWIRRMLLLLMLGLIAFALYQSFMQKDKEQLEVGDFAPNFQVQTHDGKALKLSDYRGKVILLNFWATWCGPCRTEMPDIQKVYDTWKPRGLEVIAMNIAETPISVSNFTEQLKLTFLIGLDTDKTVTKTYKVGPIPTSFFIDKNGKIVKIYQGQMNSQIIEQGIMESIQSQ